MIFQDHALSQLLAKLQTVIPAEAQAHLVGGVVRDALLGRPNPDVDLALPVRAGEIARQVAHALQAHIFCLDDTHDTWRVIYTPEGETPLHLDFAVYRGGTLEDDLRARDFTINALAVPLHEPSRLIDPLQGLSDIQEKRLRTCSPTSIPADVVRILRAMRLAFTLEFHIEKETLRQMRASIHLLNSVSPERVRDELIKTLLAPSPHSALRALDRLGAVDELFPELTALKGLSQTPAHELDAWEHTLVTISQLNEVLHALAPIYDENRVSNWHMGIISLRLGRYRAPLDQHLERRLDPHRPARALLFLAALYHDSGKASSMTIDPEGKHHFIGHEKISADLMHQRASIYNMSRQEIEHLKRIVRHHMRALYLGEQERTPDRRSVYRFYKACQSSGVEVGLLSLADLLARQVSSLPQKRWNQQVEAVRTLWEAWWEKRNEVITPRLLLRGEEVMQTFELAPGPMVGQLLEYLREAQASGIVETRVQAVAYLTNRLKNLPKSLNQG